MAGSVSTDYLLESLEDVRRSAVDKRGLVPEWAPADEARLKANILRLAAETPQAFSPPPTQLSFTATLGIAKRQRATCPMCRMRRVLFSIVATGNLFGGSEPRCARCWGIR